MNRSRYSYFIKTLIILFLITLPISTANSAATCRHLVKSVIRNTSGPFSGSVFKKNDAFISDILTNGFIMSHIGLRFPNGVPSLQHLEALQSASLPDALILSAAEFLEKPILFSVQDKSLQIDEIAMVLLGMANSRLKIGVSKLITEENAGLSYPELLEAIATRIKEQVLFEVDSDAEKSALPKIYADIEIPGMLGPEGNRYLPNDAANFLRAYNIATVIETLGTLSVYITTTGTNETIAQSEQLLQAFYLLVYALERATDPSFEFYGDNTAILATVMSNLKKLVESGKSGNESSYGIYLGLSTVLTKMHTTILYLYGRTDQITRQHNLPLFQQSVIRLQQLSQRTGFKTDSEAAIKNHPIAWLEKNIKLVTRPPNLSDFTGGAARKF